MKGDLACCQDYERLGFCDGVVVKGNWRAGKAFANQVFLLLGQRLLSKILGVFAIGIL